MKKTDLIFIGILFVAAIWVVILLKPKNDYKELTSKELLYEINKNDRYVSTDDVARYIIEKNSTVLLIDVRTSEEYQYFTLQGAMNIPYDSLLNSSFSSIVNQDVYKVIFFSNGSSLADEAWLLCKRAGFKNIFVMQGGLNYWFQTIIRPEEPKDYDNPDEFALYSFRKGASMYFGGGSAVDNSVADNAPVNFNVQVKPKENKPGGGCQ